MIIWYCRALLRFTSQAVRILPSDPKLMHDIKPFFFALRNLQIATKMSTNDLCNFLDDPTYGLRGYPEEVG